MKILNLTTSMGLTFVHLRLNFRLNGAVAQLGARLTGSQKVTGSNPVGSI